MKRVTPVDIADTTEYAWRLVGIPYKFGGNVPQDGGMDCSAFCLELLRSLGLWGPPDATAQMIFDKYNTPEYSVYSVNKQEGDFLFFGKSIREITHIAYAISDSKMLEAGGTDENGMIRLRRIDWRKDIVAVLRFV